jgi:hypothetical protein
MNMDPIVLERGGVRIVDVPDPRPSVLVSPPRRKGRVIELGGASRFFERLRKRERELIPSLR